MSFQTLFVNFGSKCNFRCRYCMQRDNIDQEIPSCDNFDAIRNFIADNLGIDKFMLWGGEPLIYWNTIKEIVPFIREKRSGVNINIITNGSLLTAEKVDFLNRYRVNVGLSHDGPKTEITRGHDVLKDGRILSLFLKLKSKGICCVLNALNQDIFELWDYYDALFDGKVHVNFDILKDFSGDPLIGGFDYERLDAMFERLTEEFVEKVRQGELNAREYLFFEPTLRVLLQRMKNPDTVDYPRCGVMTTVANIDLQGNVFLCHNSDIRLGTIAELEDCEGEFKKHIKPLEKCRSCAAYPVCDAAHCILQTEAEKNRACKFHSIMYHHLFNALECLSCEINPETSRMVFA